MKPLARLPAWRPIFRPISSPFTQPQNSLLRNSISNPRITPIPKPSTATFTSSAPLLKRRGKGPEIDPRITSIRYHLSHPKTPRPLRFSRTRSLRHYTIHRAWLLFLRNQRASHELELERQYNSMRSACEALRLMDENGMAVPMAEAGGSGADAGELGSRGKSVGRLFRVAMEKKGLSTEGVPIEYARAQTEFPAREGWNHGWKR